MLSDKIWTTRKARINTEKRLKRDDFLSKTMITTYSFFLVVFSVWNIIYPSQLLNLFLIFASIAILVFSVLLISQRFSERSLEMRNCYICLDELYQKVKRAENSEMLDLIEQYESDYTKILQNIENHSDYDYHCLRYSLRNNTNTTLPEFKLNDYANFIWQKFWRSFLIIFLFLLPIIFILCFSTLVKYVSI